MCRWDAWKSQQDIDLGAGREVFDYSCRQKDGDEEPEKSHGDWRSTALQGTAQVDGETGESVPAQALDSALPGTNDTVNSTSQTAVLPPELPSPESPLDLEQQWQDLLSLMELQVSSASSHGSDDLATNYTQPQTTATAINQNVSLHDATLPQCAADFPLFNPHLENPSTDSGHSLLRLASTNSTNFDTTFGSTNFTGMLFPPHMNGTSNETSSSSLLDPLSSLLDEAMLDEISLMDLAMEEGFDPMEASQIEEELDSDSGLSLDSSRSPISPSSSESSSSSLFYEEGAVGYSSESESNDSEEADGVIEGAVGGYQPEYSKFCRMSYQDPSHFHSLPFLEQINHNHTYNLPPGALFSNQYQQPGPGKKMHLKEKPASHIDVHLGRDERRAQTLKIPFTNDKIINLPVDEFNELLSKHHLTEAQLTLIRDIRRRGKNKLAAQNCRKRKLDTIVHLDQEVEHLNRQKTKLLKEKVEFVKSLRQMKQKLQDLYQQVFDSLRDEHGRPYSPTQYALQYANDGSVLVMPRALATQRVRPDKKNKKK
uniref:Endoplasmic reticulum membrane sensor NFE2L1 n=1 Tax=Callorhinchus milii TaxID=7868 RepID=A0A4W3JI45_CALMI